MLLSPMEHPLPVQMPLFHEAMFNIPIQRGMTLARVCVCLFELFSIHNFQGINSYLWT